MAAYYLIPFETDPEVNRDFGNPRPKYVHELGVAAGIKGRLRDYYIVAVRDDGCQKIIEQHAEVIKIDAFTAKPVLSQLGISTVGIPDTVGTARRDAVERAIRHFSTGENELISNGIKALVAPSARIAANHGIR